MIYCVGEGSERVRLLEEWPAVAGCDLSRSNRRGVPNVLTSVAFTTLASRRRPFPPRGGRPFATSFALSCAGWGASASPSGRGGALATALAARRSLSDGRTLATSRASFALSLGRRSAHVAPTGLLLLMRQRLLVSPQQAAWFSFGSRSKYRLGQYRRATILITRRNS